MKLLITVCMTRHIINLLKDDFLKDFEMTDEILSSYTFNIPKWYRAPHAKVSKVMMEVIDLKGYKHVMCDGLRMTHQYLTQNGFQLYIKKN